MDALKEGIKAVAVGVSGSKPIPEDLVSPLIQVHATSCSLRTGACSLFDYRNQLCWVLGAWWIRGGLTVEMSIRTIPTCVQLLLYYR